MPESSNAVRQISFHVTRYNPETDSAPYVKTYAVPVREGMTVLDGLHYIKDTLIPLCPGVTRAGWGSVVRAACF